MRKRCVPVTAPLPLMHTALLNVPQVYAVNVTSARATTADVSLLLQVANSTFTAEVRQSARRAPDAQLLW